MHSVWSDNIRHLYSTFYAHELRHPTRTVQWTPEVIGTPDDDFNYNQLIHGSANVDGGDNFLYLSNIAIPMEDHAWPNLKALRKSNEGGTTNELTKAFARSAHKATDSWLANTGKLKHICKLRHDGPISVARLMPNYPDVVCTQSQERPDLLIYKFPSLHASEFTFVPDANPLVRLRGHKGGGAALEWNFNGYCLSAADDSKACLWDLLGKPKDGVMQPVHTYHAAHSAPITDAGWHQLNEAIFATAGRDGKLAMWDVRKKGKVRELAAHDGQPVNSIAFNPYSDFLLLSGGAESDGLIRLWDLRSFEKPIYTFRWHRGEILRLEWDAMSETVFAASSSDHRVSFWDVSRMTSAKKAKPSSGSRPKQTHPKELIFVHGGQMDQLVNDFTFNPHTPWIVASVGGRSMQCFGLPRQAYRINNSDEKKKRTT